MKDKVLEKTGQRGEGPVTTFRENWAILLTCGIVCILTVVLVISALSILSEDVTFTSEAHPAEPQSATILPELPVPANSTPEPTGASALEITPSDLPLQANFTAGPGNVPGAASAQFLDTSTGRPVQWKWDFGDGRQSEEQNPLHTYRTGNPYRVTLTVLDAAHNMSSTGQHITPWTTPGNATIMVTYTPPSADDGGFIPEPAPITTTVLNDTVTPPVPEASPTIEPTAEPTVEPTAEQTVEPTPVITDVPTTEPTVEPTTEPTPEPTSEPTGQMTEVPTSEPIPEPPATNPTV
jgi:hypothetical protein